jgi:hypothetical protein
MGVVISIVVGAVGAILRYAANVHSTTWNVPVIGDILMIVGIVGFVLSIIAWAYWDGFGGVTFNRRRTMIRNQAPPIHGPDGYARTTYDRDPYDPTVADPNRQVTVEEEERSLR